MALKDIDLKYSEGQLRTERELVAESFIANSDVRAAFLKTTSSTEHAATIYQAGTSGADTAAALNVVSDNSDSSAMYLSGTETGRGTLKITHRGFSDGSDTNASAISIDLQTVGTKARGIFLTSTTGATTGDLIVLRNNGVDDFVIKGSGRVGLGLGIGATPGARLQIAQRDDSTMGLLMVANSASAGHLADFRDSTNTSKTRILNTGALASQNAQFGTPTAESYGGGDGVVGVRNASTAPTANPTNGGVLYAVGGALYWRGSNGTVTEIAPT